MKNLKKKAEEPKREEKLLIKKKKKIGRTYQFCPSKDSEGEATLKK